MNINAEFIGVYFTQKSNSSFFYEIYGNNFFF